MSYLYSLLYAAPWVGVVIGSFILAFQIWMIIDCLRNGNELYWIWVILVLGPIGVLIYFFNFKYRTSRVERSFSKRFAQRRQIQELQAKIHHLDKADHYAELGDVYREQEKWALAQQAYQSALERDPDMFDARTYLGWVLLAQNQPEEAWKLLEPALRQKPTFKAGELLWQCARCQAARGQLPQARQLFEQLLDSHGYFEAQYEYATLLARMGDKKASSAAARQLVDDVRHAPRFHQRVSRPWMRKAQRLLRANGAMA
jgi:hypothetical protein